MKDALCTKVALLPARNAETQLDLVAHLLESPPLVRAAFVLPLLLRELFTLRAGQLLPALTLLRALALAPSSCHCVWPSVHMARAAFCRVVVWELARLNREQKPAELKGRSVRGSGL